MATSKEFLNYVLDQLSGLDEIAHRAMMGEYVLYLRGKVIGGLYDNQLMIKPTGAGRALLPCAPEVPPYPGAKPLMLVKNLDDCAFLQALLQAVCDALPAPKPRPPRKKAK